MRILSTLLYSLFIGTSHGSPGSKPKNAQEDIEKSGMELWNRISKGSKSSEDFPHDFWFGKYAGPCLKVVGPGRHM